VHWSHLNLFGSEVKSSTGYNSQHELSYHAHNYVTRRISKPGVKIMSKELIAVLTINKQPIP
jgi:hypothetical protein